MKLNSILLFSCLLASISISFAEEQKADSSALSEKELTPEINTSPESPFVESPAPESPFPEDPAPESPFPEDPAPESPFPENPAPESPFPEDPAPESPAPESPVPESHPSESNSSEVVSHRENKQLKWLEPASFILSNLKDHKKSSTDDETQARFFPVIQKSSGINKLDMLYAALKAALEDWGDAFENFARKFEDFVDRLEQISLNNQVGIAAINDMLNSLNTQGTAIANSIAAKSAGVTSDASGAAAGGLLGSLG